MNAWTIWSIPLSSQTTGGVKPGPHSFGLMKSPFTGEKFVRVSVFAS